MDINELNLMINPSNKTDGYIRAIPERLNQLRGLLIDRGQINEIQSEDLKNAIKTMQVLFGIVERME